MIENGVMLQYFHWHNTPDGTLWVELAERAQELASRGVTGLWIPPSYKGADGANDVGYGVYDLFDLGEFEQKGSTRTKYGTKDELLRALKALRERKIRVYADIVFNQRCGADETEEVEAHRVDMDDRRKVEEQTVRIKAWTRYQFKGRGDTYSDMKWSAAHFIACDADANNPDEDAIYLFKDKTFSGDVSFEQGNFDYLMGCDVDVYHELVREELFKFGRWFVDTTGVDGFRLDALKHIPATFFKDWLNHLRTHFEGREMFAVGEYWTADLEELKAYLDKTEGVMRLFDVPLHYKLVAASKGGESYDLSKIFEGTFVADNPLMAVTFVDNHDTQPGSSLESWVEPWFKPLAYALTMLRKDGYPCLFYADYYGFPGNEHQPELSSHKVLLDAFLEARAKYNYGDQHDHFDHPSCIGWLRTGDEEHPGAMVVLMSNGEAGSKRIETTKPNATFKDCTGHDPDAISTDENGAADFRCPAGSLSVWLQA
ncbi:MAG TPA: alpha-amylase [Polyangiales bacterium]|nr:alpha-amylase [Polyangiales bacterium]